MTGEASGYRILRMIVVKCGSLLNRYFFEDYRGAAQGKFHILQIGADCNEATQEALSAYCEMIFIKPPMRFRNGY